MIILYLLAIASVLVGTAAIYMALMKPFPVEWLYYHYFVRKPVVWAIFIGTITWTIREAFNMGTFPLWALPPIALMVLAVLSTYKLHQENAFRAVNFPTMAEDATSLPIRDDMQLGIIEYGGVTKAYPLDYVIHHHIINDRFGEHIVALTYCAMCRSIIPFDVTDLGPLFVASFKNANMIMADRKTRTFFQQATFQSIIGKLHPHILTMIPFQILSWRDVKALNPMPQVAKVTKEDFREFQLPIPGVWRKIISSEATPGLRTKDRDRTFPARTHVIGIIDKIAQPPVVYLKKELLKHGVTINKELAVSLLAFNDTVLAFKNTLDGDVLNIRQNSDNTLSDESNGTVWDIRGKFLEGRVAADLEPIALSDEYWFSWKLFHPQSQLIRLN